MTVLDKNKFGKKPRLTIGLLLDNIYESYGINIWAGLVDYVKEHDANLICFMGGALKSPYGHNAQRNVIYDLVSMNNLDGLVAISGSLGNWIGMEYLDSFFARYAPMPLVSIGVPIKGIPSVVIDNTNGMRDVLYHLIKDHGFRRIAFIRGPECNPEAEWRFHVYQEVLKEVGIEYDPNLVAPGDFDRSTGTTAVSLLIDERKAKFEALVGANDYMAIYAMEALRKRGIRIPDDVAMIGFDDIKEAVGIVPALTTVRQPLYELGKHAASIMIGKLNGEQVPEKIVLPTKLIIRRSCGCFLKRGEIDFLSIPVSMKGRQDIASEPVKESIIGYLCDIIERSYSFEKERVNIREWASSLVSAFIKSLQMRSYSHFLFMLEHVIVKATNIGIDVLSLNILVSALFNHVLPVFDGEDEIRWVDTLWKECLIFIGEVAESNQAYLRASAEEQSIILHKINQALITNFNMNRLKKVLVEELPKLGIKSCYLSLYEYPSRNRISSRLVIAYSERTSLDFNSDTHRFPSNQLVPGCINRKDGRFAFIVMPLYFKTEQLGFVLFEIGLITGTIYETLASQLSSALKGAKLVTKRKRLEKELTEVSRKEQQRLGQDLHDGLGQYLTGIAFMCKVLRDRLKSKFPKKTPAVDADAPVNADASANDASAIARTTTGAVASSKTADDSDIVADTTVSTDTEASANNRTTTGVVTSSKPADDSDIVADAEEILKLINHSIAITRNIARGLFPVELEEAGLVDALSDFAAKIEYQFRIPCHFHSDAGIVINNNSVTINLYRITQEAVNNAIKHAKAGNIYIQLLSKNDKTILKVSDDGIGIPDTIRHHKGMGLRTMKYRANIINARIEVKRRKNNGTVMICSFKNKYRY